METTTIVAIVFGYTFIAGFIATMSFSFFPDKNSEMSLMCGIFWPLAFPFILGSLMVQLIINSYKRYKSIKLRNQDNL